MAESRRTLDVWIIETNQAYKAVPFTVVVEWIQEGRLLGNDRVSPAGAQKWVEIAKTKLQAYLPKAEPFRAEDQAEALEPVALDFTFKRPRDEDDDPDMIPLIDVSLVLLVFFMMTTTVVVSSTRIDVPSTQHGSFFSAPGSVWIGIDRTEDGAPVYSIGEGEQSAAEKDKKLSEKEVVTRLEQVIGKQIQKAELRIAADRRLPADVVMRLRDHPVVQKLRREGKIRRVSGEVNERK